MSAKRSSNGQVAGYVSGAAVQSGGQGAKCVMAYSGGLDTSTMVPWLIERGYEVHCVLVDVGQEEDLQAACTKALRYGAKSAIIADAKPAMFETVIPLAIALNATYEGTYRLGTALARPFIAAEQVKLAKKLGGATLVHGATGKGNDQIRFEFAYKSLAPECPILAPWKVWDLKGRADMVAYIQGKGFTDSYAVQKDYSMDENLWHLSVEGSCLEHPDSFVPVNEVLDSVAGRFMWNNTFGPGAKTVEVEFRNGIPVALNGQKLPLPTIVSQLNHQYRQAPWAWDLVIENRFTGVKSRGLYINPAAKLLQLAADNLARTCFNKPTYDFYVELGQRFANLMYRGEYFSDQRMVMEAAARPLLARMSGTVTVQLDPVPYVAKIVNHASIFTNEMATFEASSFDHADSKGFIQLSWLANVGKPCPEGIDGHAVEANNAAAPNVCPAERVSGAGLVPAAL